MNWYLDSGKESDVIVSTRIRLARNIKGIPKNNKGTKQQAHSQHKIKWRET